ncbi:MAG: lanthionine synthetase C family protein [Polyangiaceae bacterium]|jgi:lantibiotic biosynthesis protein
MDASLAPVLDELSSALLGATLRGKLASAMFPGGHAAFALAHAFLEGALPGRGHAEKSADDLSRAVVALGRGTVRPHLFGGFTGLAWVAEVLRRGSDDDSNADIDAALLDFVAVRRWHETYDLISGLVGYGVYALERLPRPSAVSLLEAIVGHLEASAEPRDEGMSWRSRRSWWPRDFRGDASTGFNLGVAHGVPGVIALLGRAWRAGIARRRCAMLLEGAVAWLLHQELPSSSPSAFAATSRRGARPTPARSAWCYGDPGIAASLLVAARATGERAWEHAAIRIGVRAALRDPDTCGVVDAGLCHGAAGLAHVFNRLHVETDDERFGRAARAWAERTLAMRRPGRGLGGYRTFVVASNGRKGALKTDATFLTGTPGIALALAGFVSPGAEGWATWDRVLLLSDTPASAAR